MKAGVHKSTLAQPSDPASLLRPYLALMRIDRPVGTLLLLWPTLAALWFAAGGLPPLHLIVIFTLGTFLMRSAGCVINDVADRRLDGHVERTRHRPLASGQVSTAAAVALFLLLAGLAGCLLIFLNPLSRVLAVVGLAIATLYPFMKRWTYLPQVVLGAAFSMGLIMAYAAVRGSVPMEAWLLFVASTTWIVAYDTEYAMVDREDDLKVGIRSTAILFGEHDRLMIAVLQAITLTGLWTFAAVIEASGVFRLAIGWVLGLFAYQQYLIRKRDPEGCFAAFGNNVWVGFALFVGAVVEESLLPLLAGLSFFGTTL